MENNRKKVSIFDLDETLIKGQSQKALLEFLLKKRIVNIFYYLKILPWFFFYKIGVINDPKKVMEYAYSFLKGRPEEWVKKVVNDFYHQELKRNFYMETLNLIKESQREGREVILVSNSLIYIVEVVAKNLNIRLFTGTALKVMDGKFTGQIKGDIMYGAEKVNYLKNLVEKEGLNLEDSSAYTDHISDLPILEWVKKPVAINPNKKLKEEAERRRWTVYVFNNSL